jgi:hypothetical protein
MKTWRNGARGNEVKVIIDNNFKTTSKHLRDEILALTTTERELLSSDYLKNNKIVYDTDFKKWMIYNNGKWSAYRMDSAGLFQIAFKSDSWTNNKIIIPFSEHGIESPLVQLFYHDDGNYISVDGGISVDTAHNIYIKTDVAFDGKVVIR